MLRIITLAVVVAVALGAGCNDPGTDTTEKSYPAEMSDNPSKGRLAREMMMARKQQHYDDLVVSRLAKTEPSTAAIGAVNCLNNLAGEYPCLNIDQVAFFDFSDLCGNDCQHPIAQMTSCDSWGWTDSDGTEYAIHTMNAGTSFVRLNSDYSMPTVIAYMAGLGTLVRGWRDAKTIGDFVYIGSETNDHGLQVFDMKRLRPIMTFTVVTPDVTYMGFGNSHNIVASASSDTIFGVGITDTGTGYTLCQGGLHAVDVSDPLNPTFAGCFDADGYTHDAQCVVYQGDDADNVGKEICFNFNEDTLTIVDVTDKNNMIQISRTAYSNNQYTHQGWLTEDHNMLLLDDELDEYYGTTNEEQIQRTHMWDVKNLTNPVLIRTWMSDNMVIDHNQYIIGDRVYQSNYEEGLRILVLDQVTPKLTEVAYFDVHTDASVVDFFGMWNAYPYFASRQIVCSVIETGLFILLPDEAAINKLLAEKESQC